MNRIHAPASQPGRVLLSVRRVMARRYTVAMETEDNAVAFDPRWLDMIVCPITGSRLRVEGEYLVAEESGVRYPIRDGIPIVLPEAAIEGDLRE